MAASKHLKTMALLQKEMQEYNASLIKAPVIIAAVLILLMLASVLLANRVSMIGEGAMQVLMKENAGRGLNISISVDDEPVVQDYVVTQESADGNEEADEDWNFSKEWRFTPPRAEGREPSVDADFDFGSGSLNPVLNALHALFILVMVLVSVHYLLSSLFADRKDQSILFWKSMPVSEWHEVLSKLAVAAVLVPLVFVAVSVVTQLGYVVLAMLMAWRLDSDPVGMVLGNLDFVGLFTRQLGGMLVWIFWAAPAYAWFLLASAAARRSPFLLAFATPIVLLILERVFFGTELLATAITHHLPFLDDDGSAGPMTELEGSLGWQSLDYVGMLMGLALSALMLAGAVWLRKHRFEI